MVQPSLCGQPVCNNGHRQKTIQQTISTRRCRPPNSHLRLLHLGTRGLIGPHFYLILAFVFWAGSFTLASSTKNSCAVLFHFANITRELQIPALDISKIQFSRFFGNLISGRTAILNYYVFF